jgi:hypothetical protein
MGLNKFLLINQHKKIFFFIDSIFIEVFFILNNFYDNIYNLNTLF